MYIIEVFVLEGGMEFVFIKVEYYDISNFIELFLYWKGLILKNFMSSLIEVVIGFFENGLDVLKFVVEFMIILDCILIVYIIVFEELWKDCD